MIVYFHNSQAWFIEVFASFETSVEQFYDLSKTAKPFRSSCKFYSRPVRKLVKVSVELKWSSEDVPWDSNELSPTKSWIVRREEWLRKWTTHLMLPLIEEEVEWHSLTASSLGLTPSLLILRGSPQIHLASFGAAEPLTGPLHWVFLKLRSRYLCTSMPQIGSCR